MKRLVYKLKDGYGSYVDIEDSSAKAMEEIFSGPIGNRGVYKVDTHDGFLYINLSEIILLQISDIPKPIDIDSLLRTGITKPKDTEI